MENSNNNDRGSSSTMERDTESTVGSDNAVEETHKCYCERIFKSYRSLNLRRRSCFVQDSAAFGEFFAQHGTNSNIIHSTENLTEASPPPSDKFELLPGVRLPRSNIAWKEANDYFQLQFSTTTEVGDLNSDLIYMNNVIWTYFKDTCGLAKSGCNFDHYKTMSKSKLKKYLKDLKLNGGSLKEIKFVSKLLRKRMQSSVYAQRDYEKEYNDNFWKFCKDEFEYTNVIEPTFNEQTCFDYFKNIFKEKNKSRLFNWPPWLRSLPSASAGFNMECPTYHEISKIVRKMKSRGSASPFDQISIIAFKRCPILRTHLWKIICQCWNEKSIPSVWKHAAAILIYKKDTAENPANFRPICLEPVLLKVLPSLIRNRIFNFVCSNGFIESEIQKGFWPGISGTTEHTELLSYIINHARIKQRSLIVTLIDLKNAFGEVHHRLLRTVLAAHHIPEEIVCFIENLYTDFSISIVTKEFTTKPIPVERSVLQGDCLSILLFNLCVNSLIQSINDEKLKCLGYVCNVTINPRHWFQFADDTAIISAHEQDNQLLRNVLNKWCTWADLYIRVDKCHTFGIKKQASRAIQYQPVIIISGKRVPPIENDHSFNYLGKQFNFSMDCESIKIELLF